MLAYLNINSLRLKFDKLVEWTKSNVESLMLLERKLGNSFPEGQFLTERTAGLIELTRKVMEEVKSFCKRRYSIKLFVGGLIFVLVAICSYILNRGIITNYVEIKKKEEKTALGHINSNKRQASNKRLPLISVVPFHNQI